MGTVVPFPRTREIEPNVAIERLLYQNELKDIRQLLRALESMDEEYQSGMAPPVGTTVAFETEGGVHVGDCIKVDEGAWGFDVCMRNDCDHN